MTNDYFKVTRATKLEVIQVPEDPDKVEAGEDPYKNIAASGWCSDQEFFFFDDKNPASIQLAFHNAVAWMQIDGGRLALYRRPGIGGPWDDLPIVGQDRRMLS